MWSVGRDDIPPIEMYAGCHPAPRHLIVDHQKEAHFASELLFSTKLFLF